MRPLLIQPDRLNPAIIPVNLPQGQSLKRLEVLHLDIPTICTIMTIQFKSYRYRNSPIWASLRAHPEGIFVYLGLS
jgi:hypothetical protein